MKRKELQRRLAKIAKRRGASITWSEGGNHSKVTIGDMETTVPRHNEINELTAKGILRYFEE